MKIEYGVDDRPPVLELVLFGLQWVAISVPTIAIIGKVLAGLHFSSYGEQVGYLQKICFVTGITLVGQVLGGHRLPLILGPAAVLLVGVTASQGFPLKTIYSSILVGGAVLTVVSASGMFRHLQRLFTPRVVAVVLLLIAFSLTPTVLHLIVPVSGASPLSNLGFALSLVAATFGAHRFLTGVWRSTLIVWATGLGSLAHRVLFASPTASPTAHPAPTAAGFLHGLTTDVSVDAGVLISFLVCYLALAVNDFGSIQSMVELLKPPNMGRRLTRGMTVTGLGNVLAGLLGVVGPVNYSLSPGVVAATGCASRFGLLPAGFALTLVAFSPAAVGWIGAIPSVVVGSVLLYILSAQVAAGLMVVFASGEPFAFDSGLVVGLPVLLAPVIAFLPPSAVSTFPPFLKPILGNGFVVGVVATLVLEHLMFRK